MVEAIDEYKERMALASAAVLAALRNEYKLTQEDVARGLGISVNTVYRLEAAERHMSVPEIGLLGRLTNQSSIQVLELIEQWAESRRKKRKG